MDTLDSYKDEEDDVIQLINEEVRLTAVIGFVCSLHIYPIM